MRLQVFTDALAAAITAPNKRAVVVLEWPSSCRKFRAIHALDIDRCGRPWPHSKPHIVNGGGWIAAD